MHAKKFIIPLAGAILGFAASPALAEDVHPTSALIGDEATKDIRRWLASPLVELSIAAQNRKTANLTEEQVLVLDKQWRAETKGADQPLIAATLNNPLSAYLTQIQAASEGLYTEIFVMDAKGLNVGQSAVTTDFWQGDEGKFQKTFPRGSGTVFVDAEEFDKDLKSWKAQINMTVSGADNAPIGAITVEYNLTELARRKAAL